MKRLASFWRASSKARIRLAFILAAVAFTAFFASDANAQTKTIVSATVLDPNGVPYAGGSVATQLVPTSGTPTINKVPVNVQNNPAAIDANGHFTISLWCNTAGGACTPLDQTGTQWQFTITNPGAQPPVGFGGVSFTVSVTITGTTQDLSSTLSAAAVALYRDNSAGGTVTGTGTANTVTKWTSGTAIGNSSIADAGAGVTIGSPTGGAEGAGSLNATALFINGVAVATGGGTCPNAAASLILFSDGTNCAGDANFTWNSTTHSLIAQGVAASSKIASGTGFNNFIQIGATSVILQADTGTATLGLESNAAMTLTSDTAGIAETAATSLTRAAPAITDTVGSAAAVTPGSVTQRSVTGTTDTIVAADRQNRVVYNSASAVAVTLPRAGIGAFAGGFNIRVSNQNTGVVTVTPTTSTINGNATLVLQEGQFCFITPSSAGTDYAADCGESQTTAGTGISLTRGVHSLTIAATGLQGITFPQTVAGTVTSGGAPYFNSTTQMSSSALLATNGVVLGGGAGNPPATVAGITTNGSNSLSLGGVGLGSGLINLLGTTGGTATIQGPAVAGTVGNAIAFSNAISVGSSITATGGVIAGLNQAFQIITRSLWTSGADGVWTATNNASSGFTKLTLGPATSAFPALCPSGTTVLVGLANGTCTTLSPLSASAITGNTLNTGTNCSSSASPAVCAAAAGGSVAIPAGALQTLQVNTTAVTANSQILLTIDEGLGTKLGVTCNTTVATLTQPVVTARSAAASFTIEEPATTSVNPVCVSYMVLN